MGATQLVVQEAFETTWWRSESYVPSLTPITTVASTSLPGTDSRTLRAPPSLKELVRLLDRHRIGGLPVVDHEEKVIGVVSGTDLVRARTTVRAGTAGELMTSPAITAHPEQPVPEAARVMERRGVDRLPVAPGVR